MTTKRQFLREAYKLKKNPFPSDAIVKPALFGQGQEPKDDGSLFNPSVMQGKVDEFFEKCVVGAMEDDRTFNFLWSVEPGGDARGYGKTSLLKYAARAINADFGHAVLTHSGYTPEEAEAAATIAAYGSFDKNRVTNFNSVLFEHVLYLAQPEPDMLTRLRDRLLKERNVDAKQNSDKSREAVYTALSETRSQLGHHTLGALKWDFVSHLASDDSAKLLAYLHDVKEWHRSRNGSLFMDAILTLAKAAGIRKVILFVDQLEDLASVIVPYQKRAKEVERFRDIGAETQPFASMTSFTLTLHPPAANAIVDSWVLARLPSFDFQNPANGNRIVRLRKIEREEEGVRLLETYLNNDEYRIDHTVPSLHPFEPAAMAVIWEHANKKPGAMLPLASVVLDRAAEENVEMIDADYASRVVSGVSAQIPAEEVEGVVTEAGAGTVDISKLLE